MHYTLTNSQGCRAKFFSRGATLAELHVPDRDGQFDDVVLGFDHEQDYASPANQYFGCTTGRYANRIANGRFQLEGKEYRLAVNNGPNHLHGGGDRSLDKVDWNAQLLETEQAIQFTYTSPDGEENYPGTLEIVVVFALTDENALRIEYQATTDKPTILNLTNHSYFNLAGHRAGSILSHEVRIDADRYTAIDEHSIPTGELVKVSGTPLDFRTRQPVGARLGELSTGGYDHNYVLNDHTGQVREIAEVFDPQTGRRMRVATDQPGVQFYTGNGLNGQIGKGGASYPVHAALCLETQHFPDSPNHPEFPSTVLLPGETYRHVCEYAFDTEA